MIDPQRYWEDVAKGESLPPVPKVATTQMLVRFAGASGDFSPHHFDARLGERWFPGTGITVHGALKTAWLGHFVTHWAGHVGQLRRLSTEDRGMDAPRAMATKTEPAAGETWHCCGKVVRKYRAQGMALVDLEIWVENGQGQITTPGEATVALPAKGRD